MHCDACLVLFFMFACFVFGEGGRGLCEKVWDGKQALTVTCVNWLLARQQSRFKVNPFYAR